MFPFLSVLHPTGNMDMKLILHKSSASLQSTFPLQISSSVRLSKHTGLSSFFGTFINILQVYACNGSLSNCAILQFFQPENKTRWKDRYIFLFMHRNIFICPLYPCHFLIVLSLLVYPYNIHRYQYLIA